MESARIKGKIEFEDEGESIVYYHIGLKGINYLVKDSLGHETIYAKECEFEGQDKETFLELRKAIDEIENKF